MKADIPIMVTRMEIPMTIRTMSTTNCMSKDTNRKEALKKGNIMKQIVVVVRLMKWIEQ